MKYFFLFLIVCFSSQSFSEGWKKNSAYRNGSSSFESVILKNRALLRSGSAYNSAVPLEQADLSKITKWKNEDLRYAYSRIRDERFIRDSQNPLFPRRSTWLYPQDGCWARAALSSIRSAEWGLKRPSKMFVFGDLEVKTPNAKEGVVTWWYHVVPIVLDENNIPLVIDPAIEPKTYLPLNEWLLKMGTPSKMKVAICSTYTYGPMDSCDLSTSKTEEDAMKDQTHYLPIEWKNLEELNRDPKQELGDNPPWK